MSGKAIAILVALGAVQFAHRLREFGEAQQGLAGMFGIGLVILEIGKLSISSPC